MSGFAAFPIFAKVFEKRPIGVTVRNWPKFTKQAYASGGKLWHRKFLRDHFRSDARSKYKHQPRTAQYEKEKRRQSKKGGYGVKRGGRIDNVFKGLLEQSITSFASLKAFPSRVTVTMSGPRYLTMTPKGNHPNIGRELTTVTDAENRVIVKEIEQEFIGQVNSQRTSRVTRI